MKRLVRESGIEPVISLQLILCKWWRQKPYLTAEVTVKPEVELGQYKGIEINKVEYNVTDQDIDNQLEMIRSKMQDGFLLRIGLQKKGDLLTIDYKGYVDGEAFEGGTAEKQTLEIEFSALYT